MKNKTTMRYYFILISESLFPYITFGHKFFSGIDTDTLPFFGLLFVQYIFISLDSQPFSVILHEVCLLKIAERWFLVEFYSICLLIDEFNLFLLLWFMINLDVFLITLSVFFLCIFSFPGFQIDWAFLMPLFYSTGLEVVHSFPVLLVVHVPIWNL